MPYTDALILAGGIGKRLYPISTPEHPKQFLQGPNGKTFFESALDRAFALAENIFVICGKLHTPHIEKILAGLPDKKQQVRVITEPVGRNTALPIALAASLSNREGHSEDRTMLVLTSDHVIQPLERFVDDALSLEAAVRQKGLGVFGIKPTRPDTNYGYIETVDTPKAGDSATGSRVKAVKAFREKPCKEDAEAYLAAGNFYWNSGMFAFNTGYIIEEFKQNCPEITIPASLEGEALQLFYEDPGIPATSFDYAITEKCQDVHMVESSFNWNDIGSIEEYTRIINHEYNIINLSLSSWV
ncbi:MAG: mannose-1-phosphate guanylyltransferase [Spirochaetaceae bacterium]|jgi:mannose-1-phosphate guanylyltransferase|nr:mannose-1-phosphate guanylyltransferase [Spirochaetaceae bacterium]